MEDVECEFTRLKAVMAAMRAAPSWLDGELFADDLMCCSITRRGGVPDHPFIECRPFNAYQVERQRRELERGPVRHFASECYSASVSGEILAR